MKNFLFILIMVLGFGIQNTNAQNNLERQLVSQLDLNNSEKNKIKQVFNQMALQGLKINSLKISEESKLKKAINSILESDTKIENILGSPQRHEKFLSILSENSGSNKQMQMYSMIKELDLNGDDIVGVLGVMKSIQPKLKKIEQGNLSEDAKIEKTVIAVLDADKQIEQILGAEKQKKLIAELSKGKKNNAGIQLYNAIKDLDLTANEINGVLRTMSNTKTQVDVALASNLTEQQKQQKSIVLLVETNEEIKKTLGADKYRRLLTLLGQNGNSEQVAVLQGINELNLSPSQVSNVMNIISDAHAQIAEIDDNQKLSDSQKVNQAKVVLSKADKQLDTILGSKKQQLYNALNVQF